MRFRVVCAAAIFAGVVSPVHAFKLPKEVTPELRAACEKDVRRLCIRNGSTVSTVKACVRRKFRKLSMKCQYRLVRAGF